MKNNHYNHNRFSEQETNWAYRMKNKTPKNNKKKTGSGRWWWLILPVMTGVCIGIVMLAGYSPSAYQPKQPENPQQVSFYLTDQLAPEFVNQVQLDQPFELVVEQSGLNDIISRWEWPQEFGDLSFSDPVMIFTENTITLMGNLKYKKIASVLSIDATPVMNESGQVCMNIQSIRLGMLPVTRLVATIARKAFDDSQDLFEGEPDLEKTVDAIIRNDYFDTTFWFYDIRVYVKDFSIQPGALNMTLMPEPSQ